MTEGLRVRLRRRLERLLEEGSSPFQLGAATFLGVLIGVTPFYGLQMLLVLALTTALRLNRLAALAAVQISIPPIYPFLVVASLEVGNLLLHGDWLGITSDQLPETTTQSWLMLRELAPVWLLGSLVVGAVLGLLTGAAVGFLAIPPVASQAPEEEVV